MTNEKLFNLTEELLERMEIAKKEAQNIKINESDSAFPFVHVEDKEYVNPKFISFADQLKAIELSKFVNTYEELKEKDLELILNMCKTRFAFLIELKSLIPNLVQEIRKHKDDKYISYLYFGLKQAKDKEESAQK